MQVLVDSDILIDYLRGVDAIRGQLEELWEKGQACISTLSVYELYAGARLGEETRITNLLAPMHIIAVSSSIAMLAGKRREQYRRKGITLGDIDCMIAATAVHEKMQLYTHNVKHYPELTLYTGEII